MDYFVWEGNPIMVEIGPYNLPFPISFPGLVIAFLLFIYAVGETADKVKSSEKSRAERKRSRQNSDEENLWDKFIKLAWYIQLPILLVGIQLIFAFLPFEFTHTFGPIKIAWYGLLFAGAFVVGYSIGSRMFRDAGFSQEMIDSLLMHMIVSVVIGARLGHVIFYDPVYYFNNPLKILMIWEGGLASHGAGIASIIALILFARKHKDVSVWFIFDRIMITVAIGGAMIRLGNFFNSEIIGRVTDLPWAVIFALRDMLPRHPTMLYESLFYVALFILIYYAYFFFKKHPPEGLIFGGSIVLMFIARFLLEFTKERQAAFAIDWAVSVGQLLSIPFIIAGIWILYSIALPNMRNKKVISGGNDD